MQSLFKKINKKVNGLIFTFVSGGVILLMLGVLIVWTDFVLRLIIGLLVIIIACGLFCSGYKIWSIKKDVQKYFKL